MKKTTWRLLTVAVLLVVSTVAICAQTPEEAPRETWMSVYMGDLRIGYLRIAMSKTQYEGKEVYKYDSLIRTKLSMLGATVKQDVNTIVYTDLDMKPMAELFEMSSGGSSTKVEAVFKPKSVECKLISQGSTTNKSVPIPADAKLVGDSSMYGLGGKTPQVGAKDTLSYFNPLTITIDTLTVEVLRQEKMKLKDKTYDTYVIRSQTPMGDITSWQEPSGDVVKIVSLMGMMMVRETKEEALAGQDAPAVYSAPTDFAILTSVKADRDIADPRKVSQMTIRLTGFSDRNLAVSDARQQISWIKDSAPLAAEYAITARKTSSANAAQLPIDSDALRPYLADDSYVQASNPVIKKQAESIVGNEKNSVVAASKIRAWVNKNMKPKGDIGVLRSSVDVFNNRNGVCRDYAVLYAALARAAGIPTRIAAGLVFLNGSFYYHAWAESYTGEWTSFDATLPTDFVDATHIKLTQGDATSMFGVSKVIGGLSAHIVDYKHLGR